MRIRFTLFPPASHSNQIMEYIGMDVHDRYCRWEPFRRSHRLHPLLPPVRTACVCRFQGTWIITLGRQCVKQRVTYAGFPDCRQKRQSGCNAHNLASYALGPINTTALRYGPIPGLLRPILVSRSHGIAEFPSNQYPRYQRQRPRRCLLDEVAEILCESRRQPLMESVG